MKTSIIIIGFLISNFSIGQETIYFDEIYNPMDNYAYARGIVCSGDDYVCLIGTDDANNMWKSFILMKLNMYGEVIQQKIYTEEGHNYYAGSVGGTLKKTLDGNYVHAYHANGNGISYSSLVKFNDELDTIWKRNYTTGFEYTNIMNCSITSDSGYVLCGRIKPETSDFMDFLLIKTDSQGNEEWNKMYGTEWSEHGQNVIQTSDGGYLIGGFFWKPGIDHSLDAMVIKTDSLGNEQWTKYYGNPEVDDDMAFVAQAGDGNFLVATVYGEYIWTPDARAGRTYIIKIDENGEVVWDKKIGETRYGYYMKNFKQFNNNQYIANGWSEIIDSTIPFVYYPGWILKLDQNGDSLWFRDYHHFSNLNDKNYIYDVSATSDNGFIGIGQSNEVFTQANMWVIKLDSMGCDTPGCIPTVISEELMVNSKVDLRVWPNPVKDVFRVSCFGFRVEGEKVIRIYNSQGIKVEEEKVPENAESLQIDASKYSKGLYYLQYVHSNQIVETTKFIKN